MDQKPAGTLFDAAADLAGATLLFTLLAGVVVVAGVVVWAVAAAALWLGLFVFHALHAGIVAGRAPLRRLGFGPNPPNPR